MKFVKKSIYLLSAAVKNKFLKTTLISLLCLILLAGCGGVVPTPQATPNVTPSEPTSTPYADILDITVARESDNVELDITNISKILLEKFALRVKSYSLATESFKGDVYISAPTTNQSGMSTEENIRKQNITKAKNVNAISYANYLDKMPNYVSAFGTKSSFFSKFYGSSSQNIKNNDNTYCLISASGAPLYTDGWIYNRQWFAKYGYSIPTNIESLVDLLIAHKRTYPDSAMILSPKTMEGNSFDINSIVKGVLASYGISYDWESVNKSIVLTENGTYDFSMDDERLAQALTTVKKILDNGLLGDENVSYFGNNGQNTFIESVESIDDYAIAYSYGYLRAYLVSAEEMKFDYVSNQFSMDENKVYVPDTVLTSDVGGKSISAFMIRDTGRQDVIDRLVAFVDWCCSDEGILALTYGVEGEDYVINADGKAELLKEEKDIIPAAVQASSDYYNRLVLGKYVNGKNDIFTKIQDAYKGVEVCVMYTFPSSSRLYDNIDVQVSQGVIDRVNSYVKDFLNGDKTADDFADYVSDLKSAGLDTMMDSVNDNVKEADKKYSDYFPDSLK